MTSVDLNNRWFARNVLFEKVELKQLGKNGFSFSNICNTINKFNNGNNKNNGSDNSIVKSGYK